MALKFFAVLAGVVGTAFWVIAFSALDEATTSGSSSAPAFSQGLRYGLYLWIAAVVLSAFSDVVGYLKVIAENSAAWLEADFADED